VAAAIPPDSLITEDLCRLKGSWWPAVESFPVTASDIRKWAMALYWPEEAPRLFWDEAYARTTRWGGIVAPEDFNPFAWQVGRPAAGPGQVLRPGVVKATRGVNGSCAEVIHERIRPGDVITERVKLVGFAERDTSLGRTLFEDYAIAWTNQAGTLVKERFQTMIRY
jgi:hypothetical protein